VDVVNLRRTIYLTIMSSLDFEEAGHKLMKIPMGPGQVRAACCVLRAACCVLRAACCVLRAACCVLRVVVRVVACHTTHRQPATVGVRWSCGRAMCVCSACQLRSLLAAALSPLPS
jgi:hypothetical protein